MTSCKSVPSCIFDFHPEVVTKTLFVKNVSIKKTKTIVLSIEFRELIKLI